MSKEKKYILDVRGLVCPYPSFLTIKKLNEMKSIEKKGSIEVICDKSEATLRSLITTLTNGGYKFTVTNNNDNYIIKVTVG
ncbi:MAG: sulfurtransferase TusA family protein [Thermoprotei archaeon]